MESHVTETDHGKLKKGTLYAKPRGHIRFGFISSSSEILQVEKDIHFMVRNNRFIQMFDISFKIKVNVIGRYNQLKNCVTHREMLRNGMQEYLRVDENSFFFLKDHEVILSQRRLKQ